MWCFVNDNKDTIYNSNCTLQKNLFFYNMLTVVGVVVRMIDCRSRGNGFGPQIGPITCTYLIFFTWIFLFPTRKNLAEFHPRASESTLNRRSSALQAYCTCHPSNYESEGIECGSVFTRTLMHDNIFCIDPKSYRTL